ncbi:phage protein, HK97 gp10 family [Rhizobium tropici CIAT 899]|uniref:HK97 gp10 family phage protein n=2 Tax=Rhizobium tropici TaxID=398 RepID=A0A6P1CAG7_RHITR|nr:phage protein, HK97 gp10 family [Rhizobium tropici CIAT 899]NEV13356.1 HK97 gp10 family phage protein [Rhizobium tropici]TGE97024.1 HK97 gp10 family phage protein [Rhizobium sp. SEMIA 4088]
MALKAMIIGRERLNQRINDMAPNVERYAAQAKMAAGTELAEAIRQLAPRGATLEYAESIDADLLASRPAQEQVGTSKTKDPSAVGIFAEFIWRFLEFGTAPHNTAKGGGTVAGKKQAAAGGGNMHPGTAAQPHVFTTYRAMKPRIKRKIMAAVSRGVREAMKK